MLAINEKVALAWKDIQFLMENLIRMSKTPLRDNFVDQTNAQLHLWSYISGNRRSKDRKRAHR